MNSVLKTNSLTKKFKKEYAVDHVDIHIMENDIYGLIGRNGAGKTTLMRMIVGVANPTEGEVELFGSKELTSARKSVGNSMENPALYGNLNAYDNMMFYNKILGIKGDKNIIDILNKVGLDYNNKKKTKKYSLGMKQRLAIAIALINNPKFLVLDEPINGLDPEGIQEVRELMIKLRDEDGITILISSHILGELDKVANRFGIINNGKLIEEFTKEELEERCKKYITIKTPDTAKTMDILKNKLSIEKCEVKNDEVYIYEEVEDVAALNKELVLNDIVVESISTKGQNLESYFMEHIGGKKND